MSNPPNSTSNPVEPRVFLMVNSLGGGGAEILNLRLREYLDCELLLLESDFDYPADDRCVLLSSMGKRTSSLLKYLMSPMQAWRLSKKVPAGSTVVASLFRSLLVAIICKLLLKRIRVVAWLHNDPKVLPMGKLGFMVKPFFRWIYRRADHLVPNSKNAARVLQEMFGLDDRGITVIYNAFDIEAIQSRSAEPISNDRSNDGLIVLAVGSHTEQKGHIYLLRAWSRIAKEIPNARLWFLGQGPLTPKLKNCIEQFSIADSVELLGFQNNPFAYTAHADLMVFPSLWEGFGNVLIEAMACGTPILSADIDAGPREILAPNSDVFFRTDDLELAEFGYLAPGFSKASPAEGALSDLEIVWGDAIQKALDDAETLGVLAQKGRERAEDFSESRVYPAWTELLQTFAAPSQAAALD